MTNTSERKPLFERLQASLKEGIQFAQGKLNLRTTLLLDRPPEFQAKDVIQLRHRFNMSQLLFASMLNVSAKTVQSWEQGSRKPSQAALRLLQVLKEKPAAVCQIVGIEGTIKANMQGRPESGKKIEHRAGRQNKSRKNGKPV